MTTVALPGGSVVCDGGKWGGEGLVEGAWGTYTIVPIMPGTYSGCVRGLDVSEAHHASFPCLWSALATGREERTTHLVLRAEDERAGDTADAAETRQGGAAEGAFPLASDIVRLFTSRSAREHSHNNGSTGQDRKPT